MAVKFYNCTNTKHALDRSVTTTKRLQFWIFVPRVLTENFMYLFEKVIDNLSKIYREPAENFPETSFKKL